MTPPTLPLLVNMVTASVAALNFSVNLNIFFTFQEFGSQLTLDADGVKMAQRGRHRRTRKPNHVAAEETSSTRFKIVEESLQRALSELHYFQIQYGSHSEIRQKAELLAQEHRIPEWLVRHLYHKVFRQSFTVLRSINETLVKTNSE